MEKYHINETSVQFKGREDADVTVSYGEDAIIIQTQHPQEGKKGVALTHSTFSRVMAVFTAYRSGLDTEGVIKYMTENPSFKVEIDVVPY